VVGHFCLDMINLCLVCYRGLVQEFCK